MMRKSIALLILISSILLLNTTCAEAQDTSKERPFTTAIVDYVYKGPASGSETAYIDLNLGKVAVDKNTAMKIHGIPIGSHELTIYDGNNIYTVDVDKKQAIQTETSGKADIMFEAFGEGQSKFVHRPAGQDSFLGKTCNVYDTEYGQIYYWEGIPLKETVANYPAGKTYDYVKEATDIQLDVQVPPERFEFPPGVKLTTWEQESEDFKQGIKQLQKEWGLDDMKLFDED